MLQVRTRKERNQQVNAVGMEVRTQAGFDKTSCLEALKLHIQKTEYHTWIAM